MDIGKPQSLSRMNRRLILHLLSSAREVSVAGLSEKAQLSKPTIAKILNHYLEAGLVVNVGKGSSTDEGGKRPTLYRFNERAGSVMVFHIFPDELYSVVTDLNTSILHAHSLPLSEKEGAAGFVEKARRLFKMHFGKGSLEKHNLIGLAVGAHGITDHQKGVIIYSPHFPEWGENLPIRQMLAKKLAYHGPIFVDNQIRFQVFAEKVKGIAEGKRNIIAIEGGIGLVAGIIVKDEIKRGVHSLAGEIGHMILNPFEEEICACGGKGCFEVMVSVRRILRRVTELSAAHPESQLLGVSDLRNLRTQEVFDAANRGDALAQKVMGETARWFAMGLSNLILAYDPEIIIIQGIFAQAGDFFLKAIRKYVNEISLLKVKRNVEISYSRLGKEAGVIGAAAYVVLEYSRKQASALAAS